MSDLDLGALKALAEAATPGPWEAYVVPATRNETGYVAVEVGDTEVRVARYEGGYFDGAFIAAANPQTVLALIERVQAAEAERDVMRGEFETAFRLGREANEDCKRWASLFERMKARAERAEAVIAEVQDAYDATLHPDQSPDRCGACRIERALARYMKGVGDE